MTQPPYGGEGTQPPYGGEGQPPGELSPQQDPWQQASPGPVEPPAAPAYGQQPSNPTLGPLAAPPGHPDHSQPGQPHAQPGQPYGFGGGQPGFVGQPGFGAPTGKKRRGVLIAALSLVIMLLLCGGGGFSAYLLLRNAESKGGAPDPTTAVDDFLTAVYEDKDVDKAASLVCSEARDRDAIAKKIAEVEEYHKTYGNPRFRWTTPTIDDENDERAIVSVELTVVTKDERTATQKLQLTVVQKTSWWVCEVG